MKTRLEFFKEQIEKYGSEFYEPNTRYKIGKNSDIHYTVVFDDYGFGYEFDPKQDRYLHCPHVGKIEIGDNVTIHANTNIVRGTGENDVTVIGDGCKIDFSVHIAHNVKIGKNCLIVAGSIIGGSTQIGDNCYIGIGAMIKNKLKIGNNVTIGMGAVVLNDVPDGETWVGNPAKKLIKK